MNTIEKVGKTVEDAISAALVELNANIDDVTVEVLEEGSKGFLGIGNKDGKLDIRYDEWIKCSGVYDKQTLSMKIQKIFYDIKRKMLNLFNKRY